MRRGFLAFLAVLAVGCRQTSIDPGLAGWQRLSPERKQAALIEQLGRMSLATTAAMLIRRNRPDQALRLLEETLDYSVRTSSILIRAGARMPTDMPLPNLRASPERVRKYAALNGLPEIAERAAAVAKSLGSEPLAPGTPPR